MACSSHEFCDPAASKSTARAKLLAMCHAVNTIVQRHRGALRGGSRLRTGRRNGQLLRARQRPLHGGQGVARIRARCGVNLQRFALLRTLMVIEFAREIDSAPLRPQRRHACRWVAGPTLAATSRVNACRRSLSDLAFFGWGRSTPKLSLRRQHRARDGTELAFGARCRRV